MEMMLSQKEQRVIQIRAQVDQVHDLMGLGIDEGIKETLIYLWALGFKTTASCEGHFDHGMSAPWIDIGERMPKISPHRISIKEKILLRMGILLKKMTAILDKFYKGTEIYFFIPHTKEMQKRYKLSRQKNLREQLRFVRLLKKFYKDRELSVDARLIMESAMGRVISQGARFQEIRSQKERQEKLAEYQKEMRDFTTFLKKKYFQN